VYEGTGILVEALPEMNAITVQADKATSKEIEDLLGNLGWAARCKKAPVGLDDITVLVPLTNWLLNRQSSSGTQPDKEKPVSEKENTSEAQNRLLGKEAKEPSDNEKLQGRWMVVHAEASGKDLDTKENPVKDAWIEFDGNKIVASDKKSFHDGEFDLDATTSPKSIDFKKTYDSGTKVWKGIYKIDDDELTICLSKADDKERLSSFETKKGDTKVLFKLRRKPKTEEGDQLKGTWKLVSVEVGLVDLFENKMLDKNEDFTFRLEDGKIFRKKPCNKEQEISLFFLPKSKSKEPTQVDFEFKDDKNEKNLIKGIYRIEKDELTVAISMRNLGVFVAPREENRKTVPGSKRPKSFDSTEYPAKDENVILLKMKRIK
jgi:uncharacterized protein (TIGR03067 family)